MLLAVLLPPMLRVLARRALRDGVATDEHRAGLRVVVADIDGAAVALVDVSMDRLSAPARSRR